MKPMRNILIMLSLACAVFSLTIYTACKKNKCNKVVCLNNGQCDGGTCFCPVGFEGPRCETPSRDKFIFTYNGFDSCTNNPYTVFPVTLFKIPYDSITMMMKNFLGDPDDSAVCVIRSTDSFLFSGSNNSTTYQGVGHLSNDSLWLYYTVISDTTVYDCKYFGQSLR